MKKIIVITSLVLLSQSLFAGVIATGVIITKVGSTNWNEKVFTVTLSGGSGVCAGDVISFPEEYAQSTVAYAQAHSMAMTAFIHNKKVIISNFDNRKYKNNTTCTGANSIEIYND